MGYQCCWITTTYLQGLRQYCMTTRSGRRYQTVKDSSMEEILQTLLEDHRQREEQFAEERRLRELELRRGAARGAATQG